MLALCVLLGLTCGYGKEAQREQTCKTKVLNPLLESSDGIESATTHHSATSRLLGPDPTSGAPHPLSTQLLTLAKKLLVDKDLQSARIAARAACDANPIDAESWRILGHTEALLRYPIAAARAHWVADILDVNQPKQTRPDLRSEFFDELLLATTTEGQRQEIDQHLDRLAPGLDAWSDALDAGDVGTVPMYPPPLTPAEMAAVLTSVNGEPPSLPTLSAPPPSLPLGQATDLFTTPFYSVNLLENKVESDAWSTTLSDFATVEYEKARIFAEEMEKITKEEEEGYRTNTFFEESEPEAMDPTVINNILQVATSYC
jgi:hypothetical protein